VYLLPSRKTYSRRKSGSSIERTMDKRCSQTLCLTAPFVHYFSHNGMEPQLFAERTIMRKNWIKQLHTLPVLHFNRCLTTEYSETTAHCNDNFGTDNIIYVP
jgi:hypothetical protein